VAVHDPAVRQIIEDGLTLTRDITVFIGENGSGKSTLLRAIAEKYGLDSSGVTGVANAPTSSERARWVGLSGCTGRRRAGRSGAPTRRFFLRAETAYEMLAWMTEHRMPGYGESYS
jgi:predicted ATPase